jgi:pyruvate,water dikinase
VLARFQELTAILAPSAAKIGGKGMGLRQLVQLGLAMPPAWVLPAETFTALITSLNLLPQVQAAEARLGLEPPGERLAAIRQAILNAPLPEKIVEQVYGLRRQWTAAYGGRLIVRSSATMEDNQSRSFAGIFDSIPGQSEQEVGEAIRAVWASVFSPRAFAYYRAASLRQFPAMALILQPFVEAHRSGVMFTRFAGPDRTPQVLVEHVAGDCEKLVKGLVNPERFWLRRWPAAGEALPGTTGELRPRFALELAQAARKLERELGRPQDVEWCVRDETLYFLQTRPITVVMG